MIIHSKEIEQLRGHLRSSQSKLDRNNAGEENFQNIEAKKLTILSKLKMKLEQQSIEKITNEFG